MPVNQGSVFGTYSRVIGPKTCKKIIRLANKPESRDLIRNSIFYMKSLTELGRPLKKIEPGYLPCTRLIIY